MPMTARPLLVLLVAGLLVAPAAPAPAQAPPARIRVDPSKRFQTIVGWEATAWTAQFHPKSGLWRDRVLDLAVNDVGINRLRLEIPCGTERPDNGFGKMLAGQITDPVWQCYRNSTVNDDADPRHVNPDGFDFREIDLAVSQVVLPVQRLLKERGERLLLNYCYVAFEHANRKPMCPRGLVNHHRDPEEYAEFVVAVCDHLRDKFGITPDTWELVLEPNAKVSWTGLELGRALVAAGRRLRAAGYGTTFVAPSASTLASTLTLFDEMVLVPGVLDYLSEISFHRYGGAIEPALRKLAERASRYKLRTSMLEHIGSGYEDLHVDLKQGMISAWEQYAIAGPRPGRSHRVADAVPPAVLPLRPEGRRANRRLVDRGGLRPARVRERQRRVRRGREGRRGRDVRGRRAPGRDLRRHVRDGDGGSRRVARRQGRAGSAPHGLHSGEGSGDCIRKEVAGSW
jgi:hypothetical protein